MDDSATPNTATPNTAPATPDTSGALAAALDRIGFTRAHAVVVAMVLAGMFFDALEQDATGAIGEGLKASFGMDTNGLALLNTVTTVGGLVGRPTAYVGLVVGVVGVGLAVLGFKDPLGANPLAFLAGMLWLVAVAVRLAVRPGIRSGSGQRAADSALVGS